MQQMQYAAIEALDGGAADGADAETLATVLMEVAPLVMRAIRVRMRQRRGPGLSVPQFRALGYVRRHPACSLTAVAEHLGLSVPATSRLIEALVAGGLVLREASPSDRRYVTLRLSAEGERVQAEARAATQKDLAAQLAALDPAQRERIAQALEPLRAIFGASAASGEEVSKSLSSDIQTS